MKNYVIIIAIGFLLCVISTSYVFSLEEGQEVPTFLFRCVDNTVINLKTQCSKGPMVISFFDHKCPPCMKEIPFMQKIKNENPTLKVILVAGQMTNAYQAVEFIKQIEDVSSITINLPVVIDKHGGIENDFGVTSHPDVFIIKNGCHVFKRYKGYNESNSTEIVSAVELLK